MFGYNWHFLLFHPWKFVAECCIHLKWAVQRVCRGWDDRAAYGIHWYLAETIPALIKRMKAYGNSYPSNLNPDEWNKVLDEIATGFEAGQQIIADDFPAWEELWVSPDYNNGDIPNPEVFWPKLQKQRDEVGCKFNRGMDLFREYFFSLWD